MEKTIKETTRLLLQGTLTKDEADKILLGLLGVSGSCLVEIENAYIEDADTVGSYDATGRVSKLWITKEDFDRIKCINN